MSDEQEPAYRCTHCPRLLHANELGRPVCFVCQDRAIEQTQAFPALYRQLESALRPGSTSGVGGRVTVSRGAPLPVALQPLSLRGPGGIVSMLLGIEERWRIQLDWSRLPVRGGYEKSLAGAVQFLSNNLPWACDKYERVAEDLDLIGHLHSQARNIATGEKARLVNVTCRAVYDDGTECGERLPININRSFAICQHCGARWGREEWVRLYESATLAAA